MLVTVLTCGIIPLLSHRFPRLGGSAVCPEVGGLGDQSLAALNAWLGDGSDGQGGSSRSLDMDCRGNLEVTCMSVDGIQLGCCSHVI